MDLSRRAYTTACRFLRDSDIVSQIRWSECHPDALAIPYTSAILSLDLERSDSQEWPVGEVDGAPRPFIRDLTPAGLIGDHVCGTPEDFEQGGEYRPDLPPAEYATDGFLKCCNPPKVIHGGLGAGGHAVPIHYAALARPGGLGAGGHARLTSQYLVEPTEGGVEIGGEVPVVFIRPIAADGGVEIGGEVPVVISPVVPASPGSSCSTAQTVGLDTMYSQVTPGDTTTSQWYHWPVADGTYSLRTIRLAAPSFQANGFVYQGDCAHLVIISFVTVACVACSVNDGTGITFQVKNNGPATDVPYNFQLVDGPCP